MTKKNVNELMVAWATEIQALDPDNVGGPTVLDTAANLNKLARDAAQDLPFGSEPADFIRMLESLARESNEDG